MPSMTTISETTRAPLDGSEYIRLATTGANWKSSVNATWPWGTVAGGTTASSVLTLQSTMGTGTTDSINFQTGSQVLKWTINNGGQLIGSVTSFNPASNALGQLSLGGGFGGGIVMSDTNFIGLWSSSSGGTLNIGVGGTSGGITAQTLLTSTTLTGPGTVAGGSGAASTLTLESTSGAGTSDAIFFRTASQAERMRIDTSGNTNWGNSGAQIVSWFSTTPSCQMSFSSTVNLDLRMYSANASGAGLIFTKTRGAGPSTNTTILTGDTIGTIGFAGIDATGTPVLQPAARIDVIADGSPTAGSVPGRFELQTAPSGSGTTLRFRVDSVGLASFTHTNGFGYGIAGNGDGGTVTQATSRTTGVTLNTVCGGITLFAAAPTVGTWVSFTVTNSKVAALDTVLVDFKSGTNTYVGLVSLVAAGSFQISFMSIAGTASDSPVINFAVIKAVAT